MNGWNDEQKHLLSILKHSFEMQQIINQPRDTSFLWNGLSGRKTIYTNDSLTLFFVRPNDTITRPCILITHGNDGAYKGDWHEQTKFISLDLTMRGFCVVYYENPSSKDAKLVRTNRNNSFDSLLLNTKNAFYDGFQSAVAANIYVKHNADILKIDTNKIFAGGYSFGGFSSLSLATADIGINFIDSRFNLQGNFIAKSIYTDSYTKNIKGAFSIGGGLPKDDTLALYNSNMGDFLDKQDSAVALLFLHGRTDHLVSFDLTKLYELDNTTPYFFAEGPNAMINTIRKKNLGIKTKLVVNCRGGHNFSTSVCGYSNPYCMAQWHWLYLTEPPDTMTLPNSYFSDISNDSMLRYAAYMLTQVSDVSYMIADYFHPLINTSTSTLNQNLYFVQPQDSFKYAVANGYYIFRTTDCEGNPIQTATAIAKNEITKDDVLIYPNPTQQTCTISSKENIDNVILYNMLGEIVFTDIVNNTTTQLNLNNLIAGEYIAIIQYKNRLVTKKISLVR
jgi:dienelactone hydrolase